MFRDTCLQETGRVEKHIEMWDVEPGRVLKRLLKPASKTPTSRWETFMLSVHEGDAKGMWLAASAPILTYSAPVVGVSLLTKALTGHGLPVRYLLLLIHQSINQSITMYCKWHDVSKEPPSLYLTHNCKVSSVKRTPGKQ